MLPRVVAQYTAVPVDRIHRVARRVQDRPAAGITLRLIVLLRTTAPLNTGPESVIMTER